MFSVIEYISVLKQVTDIQTCQKRTNDTNRLRPAGLTVHPPPQKKRNDRGWVHYFRIGVLCHQIFFPKEKVDFVGDIKR